MGAFGALLEQHFGGSRHDVSTCACPKQKSKEEIEKEFEEKDLQKLEAIFQSSKNIKEKYENMLVQLKDKNIEEIFHTEQAYNTFLIWRDKFFSSLK